MTGIIINVYKLFIGPLAPTKVTLETVERLTIKTKLVGTIRLNLMDNANIHHTFNIPDCIFDPEFPINILVIPFLEKYFGDQAHGLYENDDTTVCSGSTKSHFIWDHYFMHCPSELPNLYLYVGQGYFRAFAN